MVLVVAFFNLYVIFMRENYMLRGLVILSIIFPSYAFAHATESGKIERIIPEGGYVISIFLDGSDNASLCSGGSRWTLELTDKLYKEKYSLLLTAMAQGKSVTLLHHKDLGCGPFNSNKIYYIDFKP